MISCFVTVLLLWVWVGIFFQIKGFKHTSIINHIYQSVMCKYVSPLPDFVYQSDSSWQDVHQIWCFINSWAPSLMTCSWGRHSGSPADSGFAYWSPVMQKKGRPVRHTDFVTTHSNSPKLHSPKQNPNTGESHGSVGPAATAPQSWWRTELGNRSHKGARENHPQTAPGEGEISSVFLILSLKTTPLEPAWTLFSPGSVGRSVGSH